MAKEEMIPILQKVNATQWRNAGFKGQGIKVYNCEENAGHGANTGQMIIDVAPETKVVFGDIGFSTSGDKLTSEPKVLSRELTMKEFIDIENPQIVTVSKKGGNKCAEWESYVKSIKDKTKTPFLNAAANEGIGDGDTVSTFFPVSQCIVMGALEYTNGSFVRAGYSSVGAELDFSQSVGWWSGTSAATPFQAGMCAIIMSRYGKMQEEEMFKYLMMISKDLGDAGKDTYYGYGQPILPDVSKKYITMTVGSKDFKCDGKSMTMDTAPVNKEGNVFVPIRAISESLGYKVEWSSPNIIIGGTVKLTIGSNVMFVNGKKVFLNFAPYIDSNNRTLVPIRAIAEAFGCKVEWVQSESKVLILEA